MKQVALSSLQDKIIRPGFERFLRPLVMYRGRLSLGDIHRMWNLVISAMEHEATLADITQRLQLNPQFSHLCAPSKPRVSSSVCSFAGRLTDNPKVMGEMPGLAEYLDWLIPPYKRMGSLERVSEITYRSRNMGAGGWRRLMSRPRQPRDLHKTSEIVYPFLIHDGGKPEHALLKKVMAAVPRGDSDRFADMCQDLIVGILSGDFAEDDLALPAKEVRRRVYAMSPGKYGDLSLDAPRGDGDFSLMDTLADEGRDWV